MVMCLVSVSCPGTKTPLRKNPTLEPIVRILNAHAIAYQFADTMAGWGCLNQDWLEFTCVVETSWGWCKPKFLSEKEWTEIWLPLLEEGKLLMQIHYRINGKLIAHH